jgi:hypothetical protein
MRSLRDALHRADAHAFVGRTDALRQVDSFLAPDATHRFLLVHGPGGIGKSALLREIGRRASAAGRSVHSYDARQLDLDDLPAGIAPLLLLDEADELGAGLTMLRDTLLDRLPEGARVVLAGRERPEPGWWRGGLDTLVREVPLHPLPAEDARSLLECRGLTDRDHQQEVIAWAHGSPLALVVASASAGAVVPTSREAALEERLASWLAGAAIEGADADVLEVASLTSPIDSRLIAAALPGRNLRDALPRLWALPVVRRVGHGAVLHPALATAISTRLRVDQRARYRELVRRIALHLESRARLGDQRALVQLASLVEAPDMVTGITGGASPTHFGDALRPGDVDALARASGLADSPAWSPVAWFLQRLPRYTTVVRRIDGSIAGMFGAAPIEAIAEDGAATARTVVDVLRAAGCEPDRTIAGPAIILEPDADRLDDLLWVGYSTAFGRSGITDIRHCLTHYPDPSHRPTEFLAAAAWQPVPLWTAESSWMMDWGPGGAIGFTLEQVLREQGFAEVPHRSALLSPGSEAQLAAVVDRVFGDTEEDQLLRKVIELTHLRPGLTQRELLGEVYVSRATYFRLLRKARERILAADVDS